tara:strand:- start:3881 stop:4408 length:528 start_codon:yes stop_codon:yes gene_type:complete
MQNLKNNDPIKNQNLLSHIEKKEIDNIKEFINTSNSRLDAIISITNNSHAIAADAVTAMICENQDSLNSSNSVNTTNKMSVCLRDGEIIIRYVTYMLLTHEEKILYKSCLKDLKNTYLSLGVPLENAIRVIELIKDATISDIRSTVDSEIDDKSVLNDLVKDTELYFQKIITLFN